MDGLTGDTENVSTRKSVLRKLNPRESAIEKHLQRCVEERGGLCEKHTSPGRRGVPDRLITWPDGNMQLVETKRPKDSVTSTSQKRDHQRRARRRVHVRLVYTKAEAEAYVLGERKHWRGMIIIPQCPDNFIN